MQYNIYFDISGILLTAMLLLSIQIRQAYPTKTCRIYKSLLWLNLAASSSDLVSAITLSSPEEYPMLGKYLINILYLATHNLTAVVFLLYVILIVRGNYGTRSERAIWQGVLTIELLLILTTPFTRYIFYFDEALNYRHGVLMPLLYACAIGVMLYSLVLFVHYRRQMKRYQMVINVVFLSLMVGAVIFQSFFPEMLIESFCTAMALLMMNVSIDNPEIYFYPNSYCFNQTAFDDMIGGRLGSGAEFSVLAFTFDDLSVFKSRFGDGAFDLMLERTIADCHRLLGQRKVYLLSNACFAVDLNGADENAVINDLSEAVGKDMVVAGRPYTLRPHFCILRHPGVVKTVVDVNDAIRDTLYDGYQQSGQRVITVSAGVLDAKRREARIVHILREAIQNEGFDVFYQPLLEQRTGRYISAEALVRLKRQPGREFIGPDDFIPIAEKNGMILDIGEIVFEKVCRFWRDANLASLGLRYIEVNLSRLQLLDLSAAKRLEEICLRYGLTPQNINMEITETADVSGEEKKAIDETIAYLRGKGFTFSLDDYGSGYATASYFAEMPFQIVKIDKMILWNAMKRKKFRAVLEYSVSLIKAFERECVVEGVETVEMAQLLTSLGCDYFQGYLYSRPLPEEEFVEHVRKNLPAIRVV